MQDYLQKGIDKGILSDYDKKQKGGNGMDTDSKGISSSLEDNLKKAVTELLILCLLDEEDRYIGEFPDLLHQKSKGALSIVFPYSAIYRLLESGHVEECPKRFAPDGRRRQYYRITDHGRRYLAHLLSTYHVFSGGVSAVLKEREGFDG